MAEILAAPQQAKADEQLRTLAAISTAHWVSHFHMFVLPMLFPFLKQQLGVGYIELGFALTVFAVTSALTQAPIGYLADHVGARKVLLIGLTVGGLALIMLGMNLSYTSLILCAALLGLANSVYHPADYAILSARVAPSRIGRAFSVHTFAGMFGGAIAPATMLVLTSTLGMRAALIVAGLVGVVVAVALAFAHSVEAEPVSARTPATPTPDGKQQKARVFTPAILGLTVFFVLLSLSSSGITNFSVVALMSAYAVPFSAANLALTAFLTATAFGVLGGGFVADMTRRHADVAAAGFAVNAVIILMIGTVGLAPPALIAAMGTAGFLSGMIMPSRDMLVRAAAPAGMGANSRPRWRAASAVIAMSPPEAPMTSTRLPGSGPPQCRTFSVSHSVSSESQRATPACRQKASKAASAPASAPVCAMAAARPPSDAPSLRAITGLPAARAALQASRNTLVLRTPSR